MAINWLPDTKGKADGQETFKFGWGISQVSYNDDQSSSSGSDAERLSSMRDVISTATSEILGSLLRASRAKFKDAHALGRIFLDSASEGKDAVEVEATEKRKRGQGELSAWTIVFPKFNTTRGGSNVLTACHAHVHDARERLKNVFPLDSSAFPSVSICRASSITMTDV